MKWYLPFLALAAFASASPIKRASVDEVATVGFAAQAKTTGGSGGKQTTVTTVAQLTAAVKGDTAAVVIIKGNLKGDGSAIKVGSNKSVIGASGSSLTNIGLRVIDASNVILRNLKISKVVAPTDAIAIQKSKNVWVDHVDLSNDRDHDKDFYDGLLDITHGCTGITVTDSILHDHWKGSLVGHSDSNSGEDKVITITYANNFWLNLNSRTPSFRFGTGHLFNNYFKDCNDGINSRKGAQLLAENNVFEGVKKPIYSTDGGFVVAKGNNLGGGSNSAPAGTFSSAPYKYTLLDASKVKASVTANAGQTLKF